jgi:hypothetical protein
MDIYKNTHILNYLDDCCLMKIKSYIIIDFFIKKFNYIIHEDIVINDFRRVSLFDNLNYSDDIYIYTTIILDNNTLKKYEKIFIMYKNKEYNFSANY